MKTPPALALSLGLLLLARPSGAALQDGAFPAAAITYLEAQVEANDFMGVVLVSVGGEPVLRAAFGQANLEHGVAHTAETRFRIGSVSKSFAAALVHVLIEDELLRLEDPLELYFEDIPESWKPITVRQLLNHRSGILDLEDMDGYRATMMLPTEPRATMRRFYDVPLRFEPGTRFEYSSSGYVVLAALVEHALGRPFEELLRERVLEPLRLAATGHDRHATILPQRAGGYTFGPAGLENAPYIDMDLPIGGGELYSTVDDLAAWVRRLEHGELLRGVARERLLTPQAIDDPGLRREYSTVFGIDIAGYANGWAVGTQHGRSCRQHGGVINGFATYLARFPDEDATVVVLNNTESYFTVVDIGVDLAAMLFGQSVEAPAPRPDLSGALELLEARTGRFELRPEVDVVVTREGSQLLATIGGSPAMPLLPRTETLFDFRGSTYRITFLCDAEGEVEGVDLDVGNGRIVRGRRLR